MGRDRVGGIALALFGLAAAVEVRALPLGTLSRPGPAFMPLLLAAVLGGFGVLVAARGRGSPPVRDIAWPEGAKAGAILAACAFAALALERLGYRLTVIVLVAVLAGAVERRPPLTVAAVALMLSFGTFYLFAGLLRVPLPRGPWNF